MAVTGYSGTDGIVRPPMPESGELEGQFRDYSGGEAVTGTSDRAMLATARSLPDLLKARREAMEARWRAAMTARSG